METTNQVKSNLLSGKYHSRLSEIYGKDENVIAAQQKRYLNAVEAFEALFPESGPIDLFSAPGRTEVGGNHTDHQRGIVLAAAVNLDVIAVVSFNDTGVIRVKSQGFPMDTVDLSDLAVQKEESGSSAALIRGIASRLHDLGHQIGGFDAYTTSNVLKGSGLSSSAAFENLIGTILNHGYNGGGISPVEIAKISQYAEVHYFGKACGLMDQMVSSVGGFVSIDFKDTEDPKIEKIDFDFADCGYALCIVDTKGNHADLTPEYVAIPTEMKQVAAFFGKEVLRDVDKKEFYGHLPQVRKTVSDRAVLRAIHFLDENQRALDEAKALKENNFEAFKELVRASGNSSFKFLQNIYANSNPSEQGVSLGLAVSEEILGDRGVCRVHGGGFAGTIQNFVPNDLVDTYQKAMENLFGAGSCYVLSIRSLGGIRL
jgi:galactokinase